MLNIDEIKNTIEELENGDTTFDTCIKLAALYTVKGHLEKSVQTIVQDELDDILPAYQKYIKTKTNYQTGRAAEDAVLHCMEMVCQEIKEFIMVLYSGTSSEKERIYIEEAVSSLFSAFGISN